MATYPQSTVLVEKIKSSIIQYYGTEGSDTIARLRDAPRLKKSIYNMLDELYIVADFGTMGVNYLLGNWFKGLGDYFDEWWGPIYDFSKE